MNKCAACGKEFFIDCHVIHGTPQTDVRDEILICGNLAHYESQFQVDHGHVLIAKPGDGWYEDDASSSDQ